MSRDASGVSWIAQRVCGEVSLEWIESHNGNRCSVDQDQGDIPAFPKHDDCFPCLADLRPTELRALASFCDQCCLHSVFTSPLQNIVEGCVRELL